MNIFSPYLFPPLDLESRRLVVGPVMLTGLVKPVVGGDGGVNIEMLKHPVLCQIDPYSLDMAENDQIKIYWDDTEVGDITVRDVDVGERLSVFLLVEPIVRGWAEKVFFRVTPATSPTPIDSPISRLWVKLDPPGGRDIHPGNPIGHSQLKSPVLPPELDMVDAEWAARGIPLKIENYDFRTVRDLIQLKWGSTTVRRLVTEDEANSTDPITIMIDQDIILAGGDGNSVLVHYMVFDEVWNPSSRYSQRTHVKVEAGASRLDPPIIQETDSDDVIDLDLLEKEDVTVQIYVSSPTFSLNDTLTMIWTGTPFIGSPLINTQSETLTNLPKVLQFKIPNAEIRAIAQGSGDVWYKLDKANGDPPQSSKHAFAYVIGDPTLLPAPTIVELIGDTLDPTLPWAIVQIPVYPGMDNGDLIDMVWFGTTATNDPYPHEQGHPVTEGEVGTVIEIPVTGEHIIALNNGTLDLFYRVSRDDVWLYGVKESDHLAVKVQAIQADLPKPRVIEAPDDILDHELFTGPVTLRIDYLGTAVGDELTYYWLGNPGSGSHSDSLPITTLQAGEPVNFRIARELVEANINSVVKVRYTLKHVATGKYSYSAVLDLLIGELLGELPPPKVLEAPDDVLDPMDALNGVTVRVSYESMDTPHLIHLNWQGTPGDGSSDDQELPGSTSGSVEFKVDAAVVGANIDRAVLVDYTVEHRGFSFISESRALTVSNFSDPDTQLPHPLIPQADQARQVLNLATFTGNAEVTVAKWPFSVVGQKVWLYLEGQTDGDAAYTISLLAGTAISDAQASSGLRETLLRSELEKLGHGTPLTVIFKVIFTGEDDEFYAVEFPRAQYTFKVRHDWVVPEIQRLEDTWGDIIEGGMTVDSSVTLSGIATPESTLEFFDNNTTSVGTTLVELDGTWEFPMTGLQAKTYRITAHAREGSDNVSNPWSFTAVALVTPTISSVTDSRGEVDNGDTIVDTSVTLTGTASAFQDVEILDHASTRLGIATANALGEWNRVISSLSVSTHSLTAKAQYGNGEVSNVRTFTITALVTPTIDSVQDSRGEVDDGATIVDTTVTLTGKASILQEVEIFDNITVSQGTEKADDQGVWTLVLTGLSVTDHSLTAKAQYGTGEVSNVRTFTITALNVPTIASVQDSRGEVANGWTTVDTQLALAGEASALQEVEIFDKTTQPLGKARANATEQWTHDIGPLSQGDHSLTAVAQYGAGDSSAARTFKITAIVAPTLTDIRDSKGSVVDATTVETTIHFTGTGSSGQRIQLMDGNATIGNEIIVPLDSTNWNATLPGLAIKGYNIKAKALYGSGQESESKAFFITALLAPTLTDIRDNQGSVVGGTTVETRVTVTGTGSSGQLIQLMDGGNTIGEPIRISSVGTTWDKELTGLTTKTYSIKAKALYGNGQESGAKTFSVTAVVPATITSIKAANVEIPPDGSTTENRVTLRGQASIGQRVKILDNDNDKGDAEVGTNGEWSKELTGLAQGNHPMKVRALYGSGIPDSPVRSFTVLSALVFDTSPVTLSGKVYMLEGYPHLPAFGAGTSIHRPASGGQPGYAYTSSNNGVAVVDGNGWVTVRRNGWTTITASDSAGQSKSYTVSVTGVIVCQGLGTDAWSGANSTAAAHGMRLGSMGELREIYATYGTSWPMGHTSAYWSRDLASSGIFRYYYVKNLYTGAEGTQKDWSGTSPVRGFVVGLR